MAKLARLHRFSGGRFEPMEIPKVQMQGGARRVE
jgi:hypothetical protein